MHAIQRATQRNEESAMWITLHRARSLLIVPTAQTESLACLCLASAIYDDSFRAFSQHASNSIASYLSHSMGVIPWRRRRWWRYWGGGGVGGGGQSLEPSRSVVIVVSWMRETASDMVNAQSQWSICKGRLVVMCVHVDRNLSLLFVGWVTSFVHIRISWWYNIIRGLVHGTILPIDCSVCRDWPLLCLCLDVVGGGWWWCAVSESVPSANSGFVVKLLWIHGPCSAVDDDNYNIGGFVYLPLDWSPFRQYSHPGNTTRGQTT